MAKLIPTFRKDGELLTENAALEAWSSQTVRCGCGSYGDEEHAVTGSAKDMLAQWLGCSNCRGQALGSPLIYRRPSQMAI